MPIEAVDKVVEIILGCEPASARLALSLLEFRQVYVQVQEQRPGTPVDIVLNGDWAMAQFSKLCNHRIRIQRDPPGSWLLRLRGRRPLAESDFDFAVLHGAFYGARKRISFLSLLWEEITQVWLLMLVLFAVAVVVFGWLLNNAGPEPLAKLNELLLVTITLYLSIFLLFTVSQNIDWIRNRRLFQEGLTHRFLRVDSFMTVLALIAFCLALTNVVLLAIANPVTLTIFGRTLSISNRSTIIAFLSAGAVTVILDCFLTLTRYYFGRVRNMLETDMTKEVLDQLMTERNQEK